MTKTDKLALQFGLHSDERPAGLTTCWGARWIFPNDMLPDRQDFAGMETAQGQKLKRWLDSEGLRKARAFAAKEAKNYRLTSDDSTTITLYEDETGIIRGNPQSSYGYLYVAAWLKEEVAL